MWCIPKVDADFVARMEHVLSVYADRQVAKREQHRNRESGYTAHRDVNAARIEWRPASRSKPGPMA